MILLAGDTHGMIEIDKIINQNFLDSREFSREDVLIVLGDFGVFWSDKPDRDELYLLEVFESLPFTLCFVDGNHENFNRLYNFEVIEKFGAKVGVAGKNCFWLRRGEIYNINNKNIMTFGGALSIDKMYRKLNKSWWMAEIPSEEEMDYALENAKNFINSGKKIDIILSHTAPDFVVNKMIPYRLVDVTSLFLEKLFYATKPKEWYFGHFHEDRSFKASGCKFRLLYNEIVGIS